MSDIPPLASLLLLCLMPASVLWVVCLVGRLRTVRGSRPRYVYASGERGLRYPALAYLAASAVVDAQYGSWTYAIIDAVGIAIWVTVIARYGNDDDDFWKQTKKKLARAITHGRTAGAGSAA